MLSRLSNCTVEIENKKFTNEDGKIFPKTAVVTYSHADKTGKKVEKFGYLGADKIYKLIDDNKEICLDNCYVDNLSLSDYRSIREMDKKAYVKIKSFSAKNAFFNNQMIIDLSYAEIEDGDVSFENSCFARGDLTFNSSKFSIGKVSFAYVLFNCDLVDFANISFNSGEVTFKNAIFTKGIKDFQYADFGDGDVTFINTEFNSGDVSFINAFFGEGELSFKVARFGTGKKDFHYAKFGDGDISFERTEFGDGRVDFRKVEFNHCRVNFNRAIIGHGGVSFEGCGLKSGKFNFKKVQIGDGGLDFSIAEFENAEGFFDGSEYGKGSINFYNSKFSKLSLKSCHLDSYVDLRLAKSKYLDLSDTIIRDILDLKPYGFPVDIDTINFAGMRLVGRIYMGWHQNNVKRIIENQTDTSERSKGEQFRTLKQNFNVTGQYADEDESYVLFKRYEAKAMLHEATNKKWLSSVWSYPSYWFKWLVFDKIGLYATAPGRVLTSVVFIWAIFGLIYYFLQLLGLGKTVSAFGNPDHMSILAQSFYHSAITFFTIGYGDVYPQHMSRLFSSFEGFMGVFMMSYFTVAFVRKVLR
jgi:Ion channel